VEEPSNEATLLPPAGSSPSHHEQTLVGDSRSGGSRLRGDDQTERFEESAPSSPPDQTVIGPDPSSPGGSGHRNTWLEDQFSGGKSQPRSDDLGSDATSRDASLDSSRPAQPKMLMPGYEDLGILGRGAMGVVYKAREIALNRIVALKMILSGEHAGDDDLFRFQTEAKAVAALNHPNIVQIHDSDVHEGRPYLKLEFVDGGGLDKKIGGNPLPSLEAARIVETLARAMQAAHEKGILHRDLKSANVLLTRAGVPKITDFGLAKQLGQDSGRTGSGSILGTPSYMAPEQAQGKTKELTAGIDIYALGAILYDALTGRPPFSGESILDTLMQVETTDPVPPSRLQPKVPPDLETICLKCLQKDPNRRYLTAAELADDLARFLRGEPIHARPITFWERAAKWARRRPAVAGLLALLAVVIVSSLIFLSLWVREAERGWSQAEKNKEIADANAAKEATERARAEESAKEAVAARKRTEKVLELQQRVLYGAETNLAQEAYREGRVQYFRKILGDQAKKWERFHGFEWDYLNRLKDSRLAELRGHVQGVRKVAFQPRDFQRLATGSVDGSIVVWDPLAARPAREILRGHDAGVNYLAFSPNGNLLVSAGADRKVCLWKVGDDAHSSVDNAKENDERSPRDGASKPAMVWDRHKHGVLCAAFAPDGTRVASGGQDGVIFVWKTDAKDPIATLDKHTYPVRGLAFSPRDGNRLASVGMDKTLRVWDLETKVPVLEQTFPHWLTCVAYSPDGQLVAVGGWDRDVSVVHLNSGKTFRLGQMPEPVKQVGFGPDPVVPLLAIELEDGSVQVWNLETRKLLHAFAKEDGIVRSVAFDEFGQQIASVNFNRLVREYLEYPNPEAVLSLTGTDKEMVFFAGGTDGGLFLWDLDNKEKTPKLLDAHQGGVRALAHHPETRALFSGGEDGRIRQWTAKKDGSGWDVREVGSHKHWVTSLAVSPAGDRLASAEWGNDVFLWNLKDGKEPRRLKKHADHVLCVAFAKDGKRLFSGGADGRVVVWDPTAGTPNAEIQLNSPVRALAVAVDDGDRHTTWLAAGLENGSVQLFEVGSDGSTPTQSQDMKGHSGAITSLVFSPNGRRLFTGSADRLVKVWDPLSGQEILTFKGHRHGVVGLAFSPNGQRLLSADLSGMLLRWETADH